MGHLLAGTSVNFLAKDNLLSFFFFFSCYISLHWGQWIHWYGWSSETADTYVCFFKNINLSAHFKCLKSADIVNTFLKTLHFTQHYKCIAKISLLTSNLPFLRTYFVDTSECESDNDGSLHIESRTIIIWIKKKLTERQTLLNSTATTEMRNQPIYTWPYSIHPFIKSQPSKLKISQLLFSTSAIWKCTWSPRLHFLNFQKQILRCLKQILANSQTLWNLVLTNIRGFSAFDIIWHFCF